MKLTGRAWLVAKRELRDQMRDWRILAPMLILTIFFPYLMNIAAKAALEYISRYGATIIPNRLLPFLILVVGFFPVTVSLVVALEAFVGEKERGTLEPLLASPLRDEDLYLGKLLAGTLVPLVVSYTGIALYMLGLWWQHIAWPAWGFIIQTLALTAVQTLLMVSAAIIISTQSTSVRAANLLASFIVIPVALLIQGESALMFWGTNDVLWLAVLGVTVMSILLVRLGIVHFKRENLLGREIDMLNWAWVWQTFWAAFNSTKQSPALFTFIRNLSAKQARDKITFLQALRHDFKGLLRWYKEDISQTVRQLAPSIWITLIGGSAAIIAAYIYVNIKVSANLISPEKLKEAMQGFQTFFTGENSLSITTGMLFWHNVQTELVITALGFFSFGVLSILLYLGNFALIGAVLGAMPAIGLSPWLVFAAGILPHGLAELPSIILISAAMLHLGLRLVTPDEGRSIGETLIISLADISKLLVAVCIPLLLLAALIESNITPHILLGVLGHALGVQP